MKNKTAIIHGLIAGLITILYFVILYAISPPTMLNPLVWWSSLIIYLVAMYLAIKKSSTQSTNFRGIQPGIKVGFLVFVLANFLFYIFFYLLFGVFDPSLVELQKEMMASNPSAAEQLDKDFSVTLSSTFFNFIYSLIGGFILSLGIAAILNQD